jgi:PIN domain nuclease of toxin-antitoxin system
MNVLLDTHVLLWLTTEPERLGGHLDLVLAPSTRRLVSAASSWEIAIKCASGRLPLPEPPTIWVPSRLGALRTEPVPVEHAHALAAGKLPLLHRDPFDRLLLAQSRAWDAPLVTADSQLLQYAAEIVKLG